MGGECGCCSSYENKKRESNLERQAHRQRTYRKLHYARSSTQNTTCCCCGCHKVHNKTEGFEDERIHQSMKHVLPYQAPHAHHHHALLSPTQQNLQYGSRTEPNRRQQQTEATNSSSVSSSPLPEGKGMNTGETVNRFEHIGKREYIEWLTCLGILVSIHVPINDHERWQKAHTLYKHLSIAADLHVACNENANRSDYKEMKCFMLKNFEKVLNLQPSEVAHFQNIVLASINMVDEIYLFTLNSSNTDDEFLEKVLNVLMKRNKKKSSKPHLYGPEILDVENLPIRDDGIRHICSYVEANCVDTKWMKIGHLAGYYEIDEALWQKFVVSLEKNKQILKLDVKVASKYSHYERQMTRKVKENKDKYRQAQHERRRKRTISTDRTTV
mmetsp:Transcript_68675/g.109082  ORF Transcript_68675/g.109082 Transcript_68675/m.109082 type:complete len:385 (-) Transcript_68675:165-1319(-)